MLRAEENIGAAVEFVRAALGHDVDRRAGRKTKLRGEGVAVDLKFLDRFNRDVEAGLPRPVLILPAVDRNQVVAPVAAADRDARGAEPRNSARELGPRGVRVRHARQRVNITLKSAADVGQVLHLAPLDGVGLLRALDLDQRRGGGDDHFGLDPRDLKLDLVTRGLADGELNVFYQVLRESSRFDRDFVYARTHRSNLK